MSEDLLKQDNNGAASGGQDIPEGQQEIETESPPEDVKPDTQSLEDFDPEIPENPEREEEEPIGFELTAPEGIDAQDPAFLDFKAFAQRRGWSAAQAQDALDFYSHLQSGNAQAHSASRSRAQAELMDEWGAGYELNLSRARRALQRHTSPGFSHFLETSGLGNHPEMVRHFLHLDRVAGEDRLIKPEMGPRSGPSRSPDGSPIFADLAED